MWLTITRSAGALFTANGYTVPARVRAKQSGFTPNHIAGPIHVAKCPATTTGDTCHPTWLKG